MKTIEQLENWYHNQSNIEKDFGLDGVEAYEDTSYAMSLSESAVIGHCQAWTRDGPYVCEYGTDESYQKATQRIYEFLIGE